MLDFLAVAVSSLAYHLLPRCAFRARESLPHLPTIFCGEEGHCWLKKRACDLGHKHMPHAMTRPPMLKREMAPVHLE